MDRILNAIADARRRNILSLLREGELSAGEVAAHFKVSRPAISRHLALLKAAKLVIERRDGARRLYRTDPDAIARLRTFVDGLEGPG